jgi:hypothetical protein
LSHRHRTFTDPLTGVPSLKTRRGKVLPVYLGLPFWTYPPMAYPPVA